MYSLLANGFHASKLEAEFTDLSYPGHAPSTDQLTRYVWNHHTQPVTGIHCGMGGSKARVLTTSMDRTCKVTPYILSIGIIVLVQWNCLIDDYRNMATPLNEGSLGTCTDLV